MLLGADGVIKIIALCRKVRRLIQKLTVIFLELAQTPAIWVLSHVDHMIGLCEINLVLISDNLTLALSFEGHLDDVSRLVVKKTM